MKFPPHMHSFGEFWVWYGIDYRSNLTGTLQYHWFAAPKGSGASREAAVRISGLKGRPGSVARRVGTRQWDVIVPRPNAFGTIDNHHERVVARTRQEAMVLAEIQLEFSRFSGGYWGGPTLTMYEGKLVTTRILRKKHPEKDEWVLILPQGRRMRKPRSGK